jgi:hypothetical protein
MWLDRGIKIVVGLIVVLFIARYPYLVVDMVSTVLGAISDIVDAIASQFKKK